MNDLLRNIYTHKQPDGTILYTPLDATVNCFQLFDIDRLHWKHHQLQH